MMFEARVARFRDAVFTIALSYLSDPDDAADAAQDAFVLAFQHRLSLRDPDRFGPWIYQITRRVCVSARRARRPTASLSDDLAAFETPSRLADPAESIALRDALSRALTPPAATRSPQKKSPRWSNFPKPAFEAVCATRAVACAKNGSRSCPSPPSPTISRPNF
jgi:DNA-directed RNA polymerase specialized sigma24 family protein